MSAFCVFGKPFILRWAGSEYGKSYYVGLLIMLPVTASLTMGLGQDIVRAKNVHKGQIYINIVVCICNFLISIPLAMKLGAIGSALGTFLCEIVICIIVQSIYYKKIANLDIGSYYREMAKMMPGLILPTIYGIAILKLEIVKSSYLSIALYGMIYVAIYGISMWFFAMNDYEKGLVKRAFARVRRRLKRRINVR